MRSHKMRYWLLSLVLVLSFPSVAFAEVIQGQVVKTGSSLLDMTVYDNQGRPYPNVLHLKVDHNTRLYGFSSMTKLRKKDMVNVGVRQESQSVWRADSINKLQTTAVVQQAAPAQPSPSLMDTLKSPTGQKVIRNGLTGALTGAVASGATGGKAGKGALIGAGVGIVGGFLGDMLGQNQQQQPQQQTSSVSVQQDQRN